ncbi:MAG: FAD binding domain-containing protein [Chloroflexi bacterium]|nr:FAD binding domain-containing protein [Chloroflexota bacterium]
MWQHYHQPASLAEALDLLAQYREQARIVNGGTDLLIEIERKLRAPQAVIDISRIAGLDVITVDAGTVRLGAGVTHNQVVAHPFLRERAFALARACWDVGAPQIRNRGTVAGNLVTASPANDTITPLWALGASVVLRSARGTRTLALPEFYQGVRRTALEPDEMLVEVAFPLPDASARSTFHKLGLRRAQAISVINVAALLVLDGGTVRSARITLGAVAPTIVEAVEAGRYLAGRVLDDAAIAEASRLAMDAARPIDDVRGPAAYRRAMVGVHVARALRELRDGRERDDFPAHPVMLWGVSGGRFPPVSAAVPDRAPIEVSVNGQQYVSATGYDKTLLRFLREDLHLIGTKEGCAEGECGACTVLLDGIAVMACLVPAARAHGAQIVSVEGIGSGGQLHPVQRGLIESGGVQCGYCTPGFVVSGASLLAETPAPTTDEIKQAFTGNLCRCTGYVKIVDAVARAAQEAHS